MAKWWPEYKDGLPPFVVFQHPWDELVDHMATALADAVLTEREACAQLAEAPDAPAYYDSDECYEWVAAAIRARRGAA